MQKSSKPTAHVPESVTAALRTVALPRDCEFIGSSEAISAATATMMIVARIAVEVEARSK